MRKLLITKLFFTLFFLAQFFSFGKFFVIGTPGSKGELLIPSQVEEGSDGNIYAYDRKDLMIKVYNSSGNFLCKMGGRGEGPGEFKRFGRFGFTNNGKGLFATEYFSGHKWIAFFSLKGKFLKTLKLPFKGFYGVLNAIDTGSDTFILRVTYSAKIYKKGKIYYYGNRDLLYLLNSKTMEFKEIKKSIRDTRISNISSGGDIGIPFIPRFDWGILPGGKILFSDGLSNKFEIFNLKGEKISSLKIPIPSPYEVTDGDLELWKKEIKEYFLQRDSGWYKTFGSVSEKYRESIYKYKPCHSGFRITPSGNILIRINNDIKENERNYYLINRSAELITKIFLRNRSVTISRHYLIVKYIDEDDEESIRIYSRTGTEKNDLERLST